jgi:hypothetical protein
VFLHCGQLTDGPIIVFINIMHHSDTHHPYANNSSRGRSRLRRCDIMSGSGRTPTAFTSSWERRTSCSESGHHTSSSTPPRPPSLQISSCAVSSWEAAGVQSGCCTIIFRMTTLVPYYVRKLMRAFITYCCRASSVVKFGSGCYDQPLLAPPCRRQTAYARLVD